MSYSVDGIIFDIKKYAINDGPGIRDTVFFKGCPLRCKWCQNPESILKEPEITFDSVKCIGCGKCLDCAAMNENGERLSSMCRQCFECVSNCPTGARHRAGDIYSVDELLKIVLKDKVFFDTSGGGVTLSGGECLLQHEFVSEFLRLCKTENLHTVVDTCGYASQSVFEKILPFVDMFYYDIKIMDNELHKKYTGVGNERILKNLMYLKEEKKDVLIRVPLIPKITDTYQNLKDIAKFVVDKLRNAFDVQILPYNNLAQSKYEKTPAFSDLNTQPYKLGYAEQQSAGELEEMKELMRSIGARVSIINSKEE